MTDNPVQSRAVVSLAGFAFVPFVAVCVLLGIAGCAERRRPPVAWKNATLTRPTVPARPSANQNTDTEDSEAEPHFDVPVPPLTALASHNGPARPRVPASPPSAAEPPKTEIPSVAPQLSAQESAAAQQDTNGDLSVAEKNLESARGKKLNPAQTDTVSKIREFVGDARESARGGDWTRARNLARKARLLSEELVKSL